MPNHARTLSAISAGTGSNAPSRNIGDMLLHEASEAGIGMLAMGAYSHSPVREVLLGGLTRHVLSNVAVTPVFMAH